MVTRSQPLIIVRSGSPLTYSLHTDAVSSTGVIMVAQNPFIEMRFKYFMLIFPSLSFRVIMCLILLLSVIVCSLSLATFNKI